MESKPIMSPRAQKALGRYMNHMHAEVNAGLTPDDEAKEAVILLIQRLKKTYGHVEHEIIVDEIEAILWENK